MMKRYLTKYLKEDLSKKIIIITGARQSGKTTISKMIGPSHDYINYDHSEQRKQIDERSWDRKKNFIIFDELHKKQNWKSWLKGIYDVEGIPPGLIVTGSAKLDTYKKMGDSLAGRFFQYRLHPLDIRELSKLEQGQEDENLGKLLDLGGFPEPFLEGSSRFYNKWKRSHLDIILRQDILDMENVRDIVSLENLIELLRYRVGSTVSYQNLARDLQKSDKTIKRWLTILENTYVIFKLTPYHKKISKSVTKAPKYYFYDNAQVKGDKGAKLENLVANSLLKECHYREDGLGEEYKLYYLSKQGGQEIDFLIVKDNAPEAMIEVKWKDDRLSTNFKVFSKDLPHVKKIQLVKELNREKTYPDGSEIRKLSSWLSNW